ncbi:hypothetical protein [Serratia proteamaculans]|uniref:hypothetical protein n=1 Tax=Serratia proteamaculans TaxID=28151 RepID=UPI003D037E25
MAMPVGLLPEPAGFFGGVSVDAANGVGTIYSPQVTMNAGEIIFNEFAAGTLKGYFAHRLREDAPLVAEVGE